MDINVLFTLVCLFAQLAVQGRKLLSDDRGMQAPSKFTFARQFYSPLDDRGTLTAVTENDAGSTAGSDRGMLAPESWWPLGGTEEKHAPSKWGPTGVRVAQFASASDCKDGLNPTFHDLPTPWEYEPTGCLSLPVIDMSISIGCLSGSIGVPQIWEYRGAKCDSQSLWGTNDIAKGECFYFSREGQTETWLTFDWVFCCGQKAEQGTGVPRWPEEGKGEGSEPSTTSLLPPSDVQNPRGGFSCAGGSIKLYSFYEMYPRAPNASCIGGSGGDPFYVHTKRSAVRTLRVWWGNKYGVPNHGFKAIQVEFFNGKQQQAGGIPAQGADAEFTFNAGEMIQGSIVLGGNGIGTRVGYLHFKTNQGREFSAGGLRTPYYFPATGSLLAGFFGQAGDHVDHMGIYLFKPISKLEIYGVNYPTLDSYLSGLTPTSIVDRPFCNNTPVDQHEIYTETVATGRAETWSKSTTTSFDMTVGIQVTAGVPEVFGATTSQEYHWGVSSESSYEMTQDTTDTIQQQFPFIYPAHTKGRHFVTQFNSRINVPWEGKQRMTFTDGVTLTMDVNGEYKGVFVSSSRPVWESTPCDPCICTDEPVIYDSDFNE